MIEQFAKTLEVNHLALPQETDNLVYVRVVGQPQDIVVCCPCFLLRSHVFDDIRDRVCLYLEVRRCERHSCRIRCIYAVRMVNVIIRPAVLVEAARTLAVRQLTDYAADYFEMRKLVSSDMVSVDLLFIVV